MADVICQSCATANPAGEALCRECGFLLAEEGGSAAPPPPPPKVSTRTCPACGATVPDPTNLVCVDCLEPLSPNGKKLRLTFGDHPVDVSATGVLLGRDAESPVAELLAERDNISRRHATVGVEDGKAWVRDEHSTNGTFVNDKPVPRGAKAPLLHGDRLRMGSNVVAQVELR